MRWNRLVVISFRKGFTFFGKHWRNVGFSRILRENNPEALIRTWPRLICYAVGKPVFSIDDCLPNVWPVACSNKDHWHYMILLRPQKSVIILLYYIFLVIFRKEWNLLFNLFRYLKRWKWALYQKRPLTEYSSPLLTKIRHCWWCVGSILELIGFCMGGIINQCVK